MNRRTVSQLVCKCGGRVVMHTGFQRGNYAFAKCEGCGKQTLWWGIPERAAEAWRAGKFAYTFAERTGA